MLDQSKAEAIIDAARLADIAKKETVTEAARFTDMAKTEAVSAAARPAGIAKDDAIAYSASAMSIAQGKMSDVILDLAGGKREIMRKPDFDPSSPADFPHIVFTRLLPSERPPPDVVIGGLKLPLSIVKAKQLNAHLNRSPPLIRPTVDSHPCFQSLRPKSQMVIHIS